MPRSTKQDIMSALSDMLAQQPLDEITVKDLTERCGISRQAFYYHFPDIYGAVDWALQRELESLRVSPHLATHAGRVTIARHALHQLRAQRAVVLNAYRCFKRSYVSHYLKKYVYPLILRQVEDEAVGLQITRQQVEFVAELFTTALLDVMLGWLDRGMPESTLSQLEDFQAVMEGSLGHALTRLEQKNRERG